MQVEQVARALRGRGRGDVSRSRDPWAARSAWLSQPDRDLLRLRPRLDAGPAGADDDLLARGVSAERTATTCGQPFGLASDTRRTAPRTSRPARAQPRPGPRRPCPSSRSTCAPGKASRSVLRVGQRPVGERAAGPRVGRDLDRRPGVDPVRKALQVAVEPCARLGQDVLELARQGAATGACPKSPR